ncbi:MAG: sigma-70 family RNA polymerase sigma factor [Actinomycetales bacterium]|nr:sigma-70 family RNA polymerase sigma factor [Actinomycetales bacterium]
MAWHDDLTAVATERGAALVGYAYLLTGDQARAQDLVQEALARTWARPRRLANAAATEAYVRRAVLNAYLDEHRRESVWRRRRHLAALPESTSPSAGEAIDEAVDVQAALTALSPRERACVVLRFYDDLTVPALAERLDISAGTAKRYLSDAMGKLAEALGPLDEQHDLEDVAVDLDPSGDAKGGRS